MRWSPLLLAASRRIEGSLPCSTIDAAGQSSNADSGCFLNHLPGSTAGRAVAGNTWDPSTQNTMSSGAGGEYDTIDLSSKLQERISNKSSGRSGRSVIISGESQKSAKSDLSRVSMAIQNELHGAEWRIERNTLTLGKRLGKGGFGAALLLLLRALLCSGGEVSRPSPRTFKVASQCAQTTEGL